MKLTTYLLFFIFLTHLCANQSQFKDIKLIKAHSISIDGEVKYKDGFEHYDYVNRDAPKNGKIKLASVGTFDSLNPFILKGIAPEGIMYTYDSLMSASLDESFSRYPLIAESLEYPEDRSFVIFNLNKNAKFSDGKNISAKDVKFSFETLMTKGSLTFRRYYSDVDSVEILNPHRVKFNFKNSQNRELILIVSELPILPKHYWDSRDFEKTTLEIPISSGPYTIKDVKPNRSITYKRADNYWAQDLPTRRGIYNFDEITYDYYRDDLIALEAFKSGEYDFREENVARSWAHSYSGRDFDANLILKEEILHNIPRGFQGFFFNTRLNKFSNKKVREALNYAFDFEWSNKNLFHSQYKKTETFFTNSEFDSKGVLGEDEKELLLSIDCKEKRLQERVVYPKSDGSGNIRENLKKAVHLLKEAGYEIKDKKMTNIKSGEILSFEILLLSPSFERVVQPFRKNLEMIGVELSIRLVDPSQYINRIREFDFDMIVGVVGQSLSPGNEQKYYWGSELANQAGSRNYAGISDECVDKLIDKIVNAKSKKELKRATKALDVVLLGGYYVIPHWYSDRFKVAYWNRFSKPKVSPLYSLGFDTWWVDEKKESSLLQKSPKLKR